MLIVGLPRSGTTLLAEQLNRHHDADIGTETGVLGFGHLDEGPDRGERIWGASRHLSRLGACPEEFRGLGRFDLLSAILQERQDGVLIDKTPHHRHHVREAVEAYAGRFDVRVVWCWRDPRDVFRSLRAMPWKHVTEATFARQCRQAQEQYLEAKALLGEGLWTHYHERFLAGPEDERLRLAQWLGLAEAEEPLVSTATFQAWELAWKGRAREPPDPREAFKWCRDPQVVDEVVARYTHPVLRYHCEAAGWPRAPWLSRVRRAALAGAYVAGRGVSWLQYRAIRRAG